MSSEPVVVRVQDHPEQRIHLDRGPVWSDRRVGRQCGSGRRIARTSVRVRLRQITARSDRPSITSTSLRQRTPGDAVPVHAANIGNESSRCGTAGAAAGLRHVNTPSPKPRALDLDDEPAFQQRYWRVQRVGWGAFALIVVAALLGFTGAGGPFASSRLVGASGSLDYPRVARWAAANELSVRFSGPASTGTVEVDRAFFEVFGVDGIQPSPTTSTLTAMGQRFTFDRTDAAGGDTVTFQVRPRRVAFPVRAQVRIGEGEPLRFSTIVLP